MLMAAARKDAFERAFAKSGDVDAIIGAVPDPRIYRLLRRGQVVSLLVASIALLVGIALGVRLLAGS